MTDPVSPLDGWDVCNADGCPLGDPDADEPDEETMVAHGVEHVNISDHWWVRTSRDGFAYLVIYDRGGLGWAGFDPERADQFARNTDSAVVKLPILADYRPVATDAVRRSSPERRSA